MNIVIVLERRVNEKQVPRKANLQAGLRKVLLTVMKKLALKTNNIKEVNEV